MSAYVISDRYFQRIGAFVAGLDRQGLWVDGALRSPQEVMDILLRENIRSVNIRYGDSDEFKPVKLRRGIPTPSPLELQGPLESLEYQSCESDDWERTMAYRVIHELRSEMLKVLANRERAKGVALEEWAS